MQNPIKSSLLLLALSFGGAALAHAQDPQTAPAAQHQRNPEREAKMLSKRLGLSSDQTAQIEPILAAREQRVQTLMATPNLDHKTLHQQRRAIMEDTDGKLNAILTPAQQEQFAALKAKRRHGHAGETAPNPNA